MIIPIEGAKNVGKTFLQKKSKYPTYKFPFIPYYKSMMALKPEDTGEGSKEAFHFTTAFDITLFSMQASGQIGALGPVLIDRSFLSNVVLGELQSRITHEEGCKYIDFLAEQGYLKDLQLIYVDKVTKEAGRESNKDDWEFLGYEEQKAKFEQYFKYLDEQHGWTPTRFTNAMTKDEIIRFDVLILELQMKRSKDALKKGIKKGFQILSDTLDEIIEEV